MPFTFTTNPTVGGNNGTWGTILNTILTEIKAACNSLLSDLAGKSDSDHNHDEEYAALSDLTDLETRVDALEALMAYIDPDLTDVAVTLEGTNKINGISIKAITTPNVFLKNWLFEVKKDSVVIFSSYSASDTIFVSHDYGFTQDDVLNIRVTANTNSDSKASAWYQLQYDNQGSEITNATIVAAFKTDDDAMQQLANDVHSSNTLAQKVAELMSA